MINPEAIFKDDINKYIKKFLMAKKDEYLDRREPGSNEEAMLVLQLNLCDFINYVCEWK